jgi:hypothetical protein
MLDQAVPPLECNDRNWILRRITGWELKLCWQPQTCCLTGQQLWGRRAYRGFRWIYGPGEMVEQVHWISRNEFVIWKLKGN